MDKVVENSKLNSELSSFVNGRVFPGRLLMCKIWGSHSHNTQLSTSDVDYLGIYVAPTSKVLSMDSPKETIDGKKPDFQVYELKHFCNLLIKGNPNIVEMLFTDRYWYSAMPDEWKKLVENRKTLLSRTAVKSYLGYCHGQYQRLINDKSLHTTGGKYNPKWAYHMIRLLYDAQRIAQGGEPVVWKEGNERDILMSIRREQVSREDVEELMKRLLSDIEAIKPWQLPEEGDRELLNGWLLEVRKNG